MGAATDYTAWYGDGPLCPPDDEPRCTCIGDRINPRCPVDGDHPDTGARP